MHSSNSIIKTVIERIRSYNDEPETDGKYTDDFLVRHVIMPCMADVWSRLNMGAQNPILCRYEVTLVSGTEFYALPPSIGDIWRVGQYGEDRVLEAEWIPDNFWSPYGPGWSIQGNMLSVSPTPSSSNGVWEIEYVPSSEALMHYATDGELDDVSNFILSSAPALGPLDYRANAYAGSLLRVISAGLIEERIITAYDNVTRIATVAVPFSNNPWATYEIVPNACQELTEAVACAAALKIATYRDRSQKMMQALTVQYRIAIKSLHDRYSGMMLRKGKGWITGTMDQANSNS